MKHADDLVLMATEETVLQGMMIRVTKTGRRDEMEKNVEKQTTVIRQP